MASCNRIYERWHAEAQMQKLIKSLLVRNELETVSGKVDPKFELAAVAKAVQRSGEKAVLFKDVGGTDYPVIANIYGSHTRLKQMIGAGDKTFCERWIELTDACIANREIDVRSYVDNSDEFDTVTLSDLPQITYHGKDGGPYFTSAIFLANDPDTGVPNLSFHRSMMISDTELRIRLGSSHDLAKYQARAEEKGEVLEAVLILSCPPEIFLAACASLPKDASELNMAAAIRGSDIPMRKCKTIDLAVPAEADIVVEGRILPNIRRPEGPFGEFMGFYVPVGDNHVFEVTHVSARKNAVLHGLICGSTEDLRPLEAVTAAKVFSQVPGVIDVCCKPNVMISIIKLETQYEGHAKHALLSALGSSLDYNKVVIAVDEDVDIYDLDDVMWAYLTRGPADKRATILADIPGFYRDEHKDHWGRLIIDATMPFHRKDDFRRKEIPGEHDVDLSKYL
jgi:UbiD family decarboxylase